MLGSGDHSGTVVSGCDEESKNSIPIKRGHNIKIVSTTSSRTGSGGAGG